MTPFVFPSSELPINADGSVFHLHLTPSQLAPRVVLVGDPKRVETIASFFDSVFCRVQNREFLSVTGSYHGKDITVLSTGIGTDNIDIVLNELDALLNIDLTTRTEKADKQSLNIVRIGTCGALHEDLPVGTFLMSEKSIGMDGMLNFYERRNEVCDLEFEEKFCCECRCLESWARPYVVSSDAALLDRIGGNDMQRGVTLTCNGFYGPQGRLLRGQLAHPEFNNLLRAFRYGPYRITNIEMESAAVEGLSALLGHRAMTVCMVIANRYSKNMNTHYHDRMKDLIELVLERL